MSNLPEYRYSYYKVPGDPPVFYHEAVHGRRMKPKMIVTPGERLIDPPNVRYEWEFNPDSLIPPEAVPATDEEFEAHNAAHIEAQEAAYRNAKEEK